MGRPSDFTAICVYATIAQEESISIAHNLRMGCAARMKLGTYKQVNAPYGYYIENDEFKINEEQAQVVRVIFRAYIEEKSIYKIAEELNQAGVPNKFGELAWTMKTISRILSNVRYKGDASSNVRGSVFGSQYDEDAQWKKTEEGDTWELFQKSYTDGFPYKAKKNRGEKDKYYKYNANVPIVSREEFDKAERLLSKRGSLYYSGKKTQTHSFSHMIICRECGSIYRKKDRVNGKYAWVCRQHDFGIDKCASKPIDDACIRKAYILMYNRLKENQEYILHPMLSQIETIRTSSGLIEPVSYMEESNRLNEQIIKLRKQKKKFQQKNEFDKVIDNTRKLLKEFEITGAIAEFNKEQFRRVVQKIYADSDTLTFKLINNMELDIRIEEVL